MSDPREQRDETDRPDEGNWNLEYQQWLDEQERSREDEQDQH